MAKGVGCGAIRALGSNVHLAKSSAQEQREGISAVSREEPTAAEQAGSADNVNARGKGNAEGRAEPCPQRGLPLGGPQARRKVTVAELDERNSRARGKVEKVVGEDLIESEPQVAEPVKHRRDKAARFYTAKGAMKRDSVLEPTCATKHCKRNRIYNGEDDSGKCNDDATLKGDLAQGPACVAFAILRPTICGNIVNPCRIHARLLNA